MFGRITERKNKAEEEQITLDYYKGLPRITVPLPSRKERCRFTLKPTTNTVGDLSTMIKAEDRGIDRVTISSKGKREYDKLVYFAKKFYTDARAISIVYCMRCIGCAVKPVSIR